MLWHYASTQMNETIKLLLNHRSIRDYTAQQVKPEVLAQIVTCAQMAPSSSHVQAYTIIQITDKTLREEIKTVSGGQRWVTTAPVLFMFCADLNRPRKYFDGVDDELMGNTEFLLMAVADAALAAQKALIAAQSLGLGGVVVGGIRNDTAKIRELLKLPKLVFPLFAMCLGYPADTPDLKPRLPQPVILRQNSYDDVTEAEMISDYDEVMRQYYAERESNVRDDCWSKRCGDFLTSKRRDEVDAVLKEAGFLKQK